MYHYDKEQELINIINMTPQWAKITIIGCFITLIALAIVSEWLLFKKANESGWKSIIPIYNIWISYKIICGRGTAMFRLLIPLYNIYWLIKSCIKKAHAYGFGTGFGVFFLFFPTIGNSIMGLGSSRYEGIQKM